MSLAGWATLTNSTGTVFEQAEVQLVAGKLNILAAEEGGSAAEPRLPAERAAKARPTRARHHATKPHSAEVALLRDCFATDMPLP